ncbi:hypothetical protein C8P68_11174 [Mucilaginibacter yixingensis]|uniref:Lipoprotein n=1 Tax=Mucilaginibacter yixingensis TaxID=1295612 RepID=A0A2T5J4V9_9SPHI|nr:hypothetical protein [Mucilaginibacter yixingensis]PTQ92697.1 hypothetical protein C8P68_11174 [Mucilaginibacter yixingensis]
MKLLKYSWLLLLTGALACKQKNSTTTVVKTNYIEFIHTGTEGKPILPLIISTQKVKAPFSRTDSEAIRTIIKMKDVDDATRAQFQRQVVTDAKTYSTVIDFLKKADSYYTGSGKVNRGDARDFSVNMEGDTKEIYYRTSKQFFEALLKQLQAAGADQKVINQVDSVSVKIAQ